MNKVDLINMKKYREKITKKALKKAKGNPKKAIKILCEDVRKERTKKQELEERIEKLSRKDKKKIEEVINQKINEATPKELEDALDWLNNSQRLLKRYGEEVISKIWQKYSINILVIADEFKQKGFQQGKAEGYQEGIKQKTDVMKKEWQDEARKKALKEFEKVFVRWMTDNFQSTIDNKVVYLGEDYSEDLKELKSKLHSHNTKNKKSKLFASREIRGMLTDGQGGYYPADTNSLKENAGIRAFETGETSRLSDARKGGGEK